MQDFPPYLSVHIFIWLQCFVRQNKSKVVYFKDASVFWLALSYPLTSFHPVNSFGYSCRAYLYSSTVWSVLFHSLISRTNLKLVVTSSENATFLRSRFFSCRHGIWHTLYGTQTHRLGKYIQLFLEFCFFGQIHLQKTTTKHSKKNWIHGSCVCWKLYFTTSKVEFNTKSLLVHDKFHVWSTDNWQSCLCVLESLETVILKLNLYNVFMMLHQGVLCSL